jgi:hypothetical protein
MEEAASTIIRFCCFTPSSLPAVLLRAPSILSFFIIQINYQKSRRKDKFEFLDSIFVLPREAIGFRCEIVGLPKVGQSTIFNGLTAGGPEVANYLFCTIEATWREYLSGQRWSLYLGLFPVTLNLWPERKASCTLKGKITPFRMEPSVTSVAMSKEKG